MNLKTLLLCEDVRLEIGGTLTLVGVFNERLIVEAGEREIILPRLAFVGVVAGLRGLAEIGFRFRVWMVDGDEPPDPPMAIERHDPAMDEHNFVMSQAPMVFPDPGIYELIFDVEAGGAFSTYSYRFELSRVGEPSLAELA